MNTLNKKRILFIINPISGTGRKKIIEKLAPRVLGDSFSIDFVYTNAPKHAIELSRKNASSYDVIVAVGGDGTINEVATGLINSDCAMGIIPRGSGNGLARFLKIPLTIRGSLKVLKSGIFDSIDTASINDKYFVNIAGFGFDAKVGHKFAEVKRRGALPYIRIILKEFIKFKGHHFEISLDGVHIKQNAFLVSVANSDQWGLNAKIAPHAKINDGILNISVVKKFPVGVSLPLAMRLFNGSIHKSRYIDTYAAKEIILINKEGFYAHIDGEPIHFDTDVTIKILPKSLKIIFPS